MPILENIAKEDKIIDVYNIRIYLVHDISKVSIDLKEENIDIVVYIIAQFFQ